ncbi:MAG: hypothetical protein JST54_06875 [Deltaproteobacteria bacterium]|nr:hypothetical protein [Deltaproteobacteria bacterium]
MKLGELLLAARLISETQLNTALDEQRKWCGNLGEILVCMTCLRLPEAAGAHPGRSTRATGDQNVPLVLASRNTAFAPRSTTTMWVASRK